MDNIIKKNVILRYQFLQINSSYSYENIWYACRCGFL